jgi:hypothetical protein
MKCDRDEVQDSSADDQLCYCTTVLLLDVCTGTWESSTYTHIQRFATYSFDLLQDCLSRKPKTRDKGQVKLLFTEPLLAKASLSVAVGNQIIARSFDTTAEVDEHLRDSGYRDNFSL